MPNVEVIFQVAAIGIVVAILHSVLNQAGRSEMAFLTTIVGLALVLFFVIKLLNQLFDAVRTMFPIQ